MASQVLGQVDSMNESNPLARQHVSSQLACSLLHRPTCPPRCVWKCLRNLFLSFADGSLPTPSSSRRTQERQDVHHHRDDPVGAVVRHVAGGHAHDPRGALHQPVAGRHLHRLQPRVGQEHREDRHQRVRRGQQGRRQSGSFVMQSSAKKGFY